MVESLLELKLSNVVEGRLKELTRDKDAFKKYVDVYHEKCPFSRQQYEFHRNVIERIRDSERLGIREKLIEDEFFLKKIYETVKKWAGRGGTIDESTFLKVIKNEDVQNKLKEMVPCKLEELCEKSRADLISLFVKLANSKIKNSKAQLVVVSKTLHHLLPDLVPPIDRKYILEFFGFSNYQSPIATTYDLQHKEAKMFDKILREFNNICKRLSLTKENTVTEFGSPLTKWGENWNTSLPKVIDNAIIGYLVMKPIFVQTK